MKSNDILNKEEIRAAMHKALQENDAEGYSRAITQMMECIQEELKQQYEEALEQAKHDADRGVLAQRGVRQLTNQERVYYQQVGKAMQASDPKQALANLDVVMPETVLHSVFEDLKTEHPLLSHIQFTPTGAAIKMLLNTNGRQEAQWGQLCDKIIKEILAGYKEVDTGLQKLSAFLPVCKAMIDLGPEWLDSFVRQVLYEALANGLEAGIVAGDGKDKPVGMNRNIAPGVAVVNGAYPEKEAIVVTNLDVKTVGNLVSLLAVNENGQYRVPKDVILIVNPQDYLQKVMPATTVMAPDGTYRNDVMPYPMTVIQSAALNKGKALLGMGYKYFLAAGMDTNGRIEYSDHYQFLEDARVYLIKLYANGFPMDNNAFLSLDISKLQPKTYLVTQLTEQKPSTNAAISDLRIGSLQLTPAVSAETTTYTAQTTNATNTITVVPADAGATIEIAIKAGDDEAQSIENGTAATWKEGDNTVTVTITAEDGTTKATYTVTVTKA